MSFAVLWCVEPYMLYLSIMLSPFGFVTIYPCIGSERASRAHHPALYSANLGISWSYTQLERDKQPHELVGKP
jgi:hypothetical protein